MQLEKFSGNQISRISQNDIPCCKVCGGNTVLFDVVDFKKTCSKEPYPNGLRGVPIYYFQCKNCGFIFTDFFDQFSESDFTRYVYNEEYKDAIDPEWVSIRPQRNVREVLTFLGWQKGAVVGLDYGGGNGLTAKLLREQGLEYDTYDPFGAKHLRKENEGRYNFCSSFEVFEHTTDPVGTFREIVSLCNSDRLVVYVGTAVNNKNATQRNRLLWDYASPRNGHISLHSRESLNKIAEIFGFECLHTRGVHLFFRGFNKKLMFAKFVSGKLRRKIESIWAS